MVQSGLQLWYNSLDSIEYYRIYSCNELICGLNTKKRLLMLGLGMMHIHSPYS